MLCSIHLLNLMLICNAMKDLIVQKTVGYHRRWPHSDTGVEGRSRACAMMTTRARSPPRQGASGCGTNPSKKRRKYVHSKKININELKRRAKK